MGLVWGWCFVSGAVSLMLGGVGLTVTVSPNPVSTTGNTSTIQSAFVTGVVSGGSGSYSYLWSKQSGDAITVVDATSASTRFQAASMLPEETRDAVFLLQVTDLVSGLSKDSDAVNVAISRDPI